MYIYHVIPYSTHIVLYITYIMLYCIALYSTRLQGVLTAVVLYSAVEIRVFRPPKGARGIEHLTAIDCSSCLPTCHNSRYALDYSYADDSNPNARNCGGYLDVFYKDLTAIKYRQQLAFDLMDLVG